MNRSLQDITAIVATREREIPLHHMVTSFHAYYPKLKIIAVDSSERPTKRNDILHILVDSDVGISEPRNIALNQVKTPLFLLLDDDYICTRKTNLQKLMNQIDWLHDIVWGAINNIESEQYYFHWYYEIINGILCHFVDKKNPISKRYETLFNFFVGQTESIVTMWWWDNKLKYAREHDDFFLTAKEHNLWVAYNPSVSVDHYNYPKYHGWLNSQQSVEHFLKKRNLKDKVELRLIQKSWIEPYISCHTCMGIPWNIPTDIKERIVSTYGNYPIKISWNA